MNGDGCEVTCSPTGCGDGIPDVGEQCDDGNILNGDCCSAGCQFEAAGSPCAADRNECTTDVCDGTGGCGVPAPSAVGCRVTTRPGRGALVLRAPDKLRWRWVRGEETPRIAFGDPLSSDRVSTGRFGTTYSLCIYDATGGSVPIFQAVAPNDGTCARGRPCWFDGAGLRIEYSDADTTPDGIRRIRLKPGEEGRASVMVTGPEENLVLPGPQLSLPVIVQLGKPPTARPGATTPRSSGQTRTRSLTQDRPARLGD